MQRTYLNPVYRHSCPDPFALKYCGEYWCYFTGKQADGREFGILHSTDLVGWKYVSGALVPIPGEHPCYWAPEVVYLEGVFYLYYSVGNEENMQIRVATSSRPDGPFIDSGRVLTSEPFAIDAHVFIEDDGAWYLFYATDFLDVERVGTGTVMDCMLDPFTLAGKPRPVTRAKFDWQIFDPQRAEKGGARWHTVEGPFVLKHHGRYYQMFSGGNWKNDSYGVAYGVTERLDSPGEWLQPCDGVQVQPVLRSIPGQGVIGPGHNSVVRGPDNQTMYCIYHRWQPETQERVLAIDPLGWEGERLVVHGPCTTPQPAPPLPLIAGFERFRKISGVWGPKGGAWQLESNGEQAEVVLEDLPTSFLLEVSWRFSGDSSGEISLALADSQEEVLRLSLSPASRQAQLVAGERLPTVLPDGFDPQAFHLLRIEATGSKVHLSIDAPRLDWELPVSRVADTLHFFSTGAPADFAGFALSEKIIPA